MDVKDEEIEEMMAWLQQQVSEQGIELVVGEKPSYVSAWVVSVPVSTKQMKGSVGKRVNILTRLEESWYRERSAQKNRRRLLLVPQS
jgi:hypothetical protein